MRYYNNLYNDIKDSLKNPDAIANGPHFGPPRDYTTSVSDRTDLLI